MTKLTQKLFISCNNLLNVKFNPIHVLTKRELVGLLQQSIPFCVDLVYIMVHFPKFSFIIFIVLNAEKSSSLHKIILENKTQSKKLVVLIYNQVYFSFD